MRASSYLLPALMAAVTVATACARVPGPLKDDALPGPMTPMMIARERALVESLAAMAVPGIRLCRETTIGIGVRERVEGESQGVQFDTRQVVVKVTRLGQGPLMVAGREVKIGETVRDDPLAWTPCQ